MQPSKLFILMPAYNEAGVERYAREVTNVFASNFPYLETHLLVIDDGSRHPVELEEFEIKKKQSLSGFETMKT